MAEAAGITKAMLSGFETGDKLPSLGSLAAILDALGAGFAELQRVLDFLEGKA